MFLQSPREQSFLCLSLCWAFREAVALLSKFHARNICCIHSIAHSALTYGGGGGGGGGSCAAVAHDYQISRWNCQAGGCLSTPPSTHRCSSFSKMRSNVSVAIPLALSMVLLLLGALRQQSIEDQYKAQRGSSLLESQVIHC